MLAKDRRVFLSFALKNKNKKIGSINDSAAA